MGYVVAKYLRISIQDASTGSLSIPAQRAILDRFISEMPCKDLQILEFVDDGYSGTNTERPGLQAMLAEVMAGGIDCILVKDFSRLGRNTIDTGYFVEQVFPLYKVRFVAVTDAYDSASQSVSAEETFKMFVSEVYSFDLARKIRSARAELARRGESVTKNCAFGYRLNAQRQMEEDPQAAATVRRIFQLALLGESHTAIQRRLYEEKRPRPSVYKKYKKAKHDAEGSPFHWGTSVIRAILHNEQYVGTYLAGKSSTREVGSRHRIALPESQWIRIPGHHPALVSQEDFDRVQALLAARAIPDAYSQPMPTKTTSSKKAELQKPVSSLKGKAFCAICGHVLQMNTTQNPSFFCRYTRPFPDMPCHGLSISTQELEQAVLEALKEHAGKLSMRPHHREGMDNSEIGEPVSRHGLVVIYEQLLAGELSPTEYAEMRAGLSEDRQVWHTAHRPSNMSFQKRDEPIEQALLNESLASLPLNIEVVEAFIEKVLVHHNGHTEICWKHKTAA